MSAATYDHEAFLNDKYDVTGVDLETVAHVAPAADRPALCLESTGVHWTLGVVLATTAVTACAECLAIADRLGDIKIEDLARLAAGVGPDVTVLPTVTRLDTEALPMRDLATRELVAVRLLCDPADPLTALKADLWQEIRAERPHVFAALAARDVAGAYAAAAAREADR